MTTTAPTNLSTLGSLVLTRMLIVGEQGESAATIKKDVGPLLAHRSVDTELGARIDQALIDLVALGLVTRLPAQTKSKTAAPKYLPTAEGRGYALEFLGVTQLKPKTTWSVLKTIYLPARALGKPASSDAWFKAVKSEPNFQAILLKRQYGLPVAEVPKPKEAIEALAWKLMGFDGETRKFTLDNIKAALINRESGDERATKPNKAAIKLLAHRLGMKTDDPKKLRDAIVRDWIDKSETPSTTDPKSIELDLPTFAERVKAAARVCPTGRWGDNKVFIAYVWWALQSDPAFQEMDLPAFKERLAEANNARLLDLSRADLVQAMDPKDVEESELQYLNATFHFIRI